MSAIEMTATTYAELIAADPNFERELWQDTVIEDSKNHDIFNQFTGGEGSGKPCITKSNEGLEAGHARTVKFTNIAEVGGQGVLDETQLKGTERKLSYDGFELTLGLLRHSIGYTQLIDLFRFGRGKAAAQAARLESRWYGRKMADDKMIALRDDALKSATGENLYIVGGHSSLDDLTSADTISTAHIENSKESLQGLGFMPMEMERGNMNAEVPQALFFGPDEGLRPLKSQSAYQAAIREARQRAASNPQFKGDYVTWDGNIIFNHNVAELAIDGRLGTPLRPIVRLGTAIADATPTQLTGGGIKFADLGSDYFANFPGFPWKFFKDQTLPVDNQTYYAIIYNQSGPDKGKYEGVSYTAAGFTASGDKLTVTRAVASVIATDDDKYSNAHPSNSLIIPCTKNGVPLVFFLHMGQMAVCHGKGVFELEQITAEDDYKNGRGEAHINGVGIQALRGLSPYQDVLGRRPNYMLVAAALPLNRLGLNEYDPS